MGRRQIAATYGEAVADNPAHLTVLTTRMVSDPTCAVFVAEQYGTVVGMIGVVSFAHHLSGAAMVGEVAWWVDPEARGSGLALLRRAEQWARERGATAMQVAAPGGSDVGRLYERRGYRLVETTYQRPVAPVFRVEDNVLPDWRAYRGAILAQPFADVEAGPGVVFHGIGAVDAQVPEWIRSHYPALTPTMTFARQSPKGQIEPNFIHTDRDMGEWTGILYLNPDPVPEDGTTFWRHRATGAIASTAMTPADMALEMDAWRDLDQWEPWHTIAARPNRLALFPAGYFHSRALAENYGTGETARLVQVVFGTGRL
jgi:GNAT superfamily N-acetyltransferase